ncbi:MAG: endopeptidase [Solirubrobacterales bacterium]|jgi:STE24 endopeptidase|nr:endopeptidase [Solirubrobacterales bacterium]
MAISGLRRRISGSQAARAGLCFAALIVVAEGAVLLLAPSEEGIPPQAVEAGDYFDPAELERATDFREGQRVLLVGGLAAQALVIGALAVGRPQGARDLLARLSSRSVLGTAAAGVLVVVVAEVAAFPMTLAAHERSVDVGLSTQTLGPWLGDQAKGLAIGAIMAGAGAAALSALIRRSPHRWWIPGSIVVVGYGAAMSLLAPILIAPRFNDFDELPQSSELRANVVELGERAGVEVGDVYRVDASRRSTALNAYVAGIGPTKRVVLYDTLIDGTSEPELESVVAHELGHVAHSDIPRGILFAALVTPLGLLLVRELSGSLSRRSAAEPGSAAAVPALLLAIAVVSFAANVPANQLSREVEASADAFALRITDDPQGLVDLQVRLAGKNLSDVDPPAWVTALFGTHPTTLERIGSARAWEDR